MLCYPIGRLISRVSIGVVGATLACVAVASEAPTRVVEEVIVTAQKREQAAADIPIAMSVMSSEDLTEKRIQDFADLSVAVSALNVARGNSTNNPVIAIRGIGSTDPWINNNPSVSVFRDGVYLPFGAYLSMPLFDLERVEVLKGPQAGLYGRNSIAGAINFVSTRPGEEPGGYLDISYGRFGEAQLRGAIDTPVSDTLLLRWATVLEQGGGYMTRIGTVENTAGFTRVPGVIPPIPAYQTESGYGDKNIFATRVSALWHATDNLEVDLRFHYGTDKSEIVNSTNLTGDPLGVFQPSVDGVYNDYDNVAGKMDAQGHGLSMQISWDGPNFTLTSLTGLENLSRNYSTGDFTPLRLAEPTYDEEISSVSQEFRINGDSGPLNWLGGLNMTRDSIDYYRDLASWDYLLGELVSEYNQDDESWSVFGQTDWQFNDSALLSFGLRYTKEDKKYVGGSYENDPFGTSIVARAFPGVAGGLWGNPHYNNDDVSGQIKLSWTGIKDTLVYGAVSRGFKSGGFDGSGIVNTTGFLPYDAEQLIAYESGVKSRLLEGTLELSASAFFYDYSDKQVLAILDLGNGITEAVTQNAAVSKVTGLDFELKYLVGDAWSFGLSGTLLHSKITDWNSDDPAEAQARIGNELPGTPKSNLTGDIRWQSEVAGHDVDATLWAVYSDATFRDVQNTPGLRSDSYTLLNARVSWGRTESGWSLYLYGRNLADREYRTSVRTLVGMEGAYYGQPRTYGVGLNWTF